MKLFFNSPFFCFVLILCSSLHLRAQDVPLTEVDELPSFPGGIPALKKYLDTGLGFPQVTDLAVEKLVIVKFVVGSNGKVRSPKAIRLIKAMPTWVPATEDGQAIPSEQKIVVNFKVDEEATSHVYENVDEMPAFPSGQQGLKLFLANNLRYPEDAKATSIEGTVIVHSVVEKNGRLSSLMVSQSVSESLDREAIRLMKLMPYWNPGKLNGNPERVVIYLPIRFKLK